MRQNRTWFLQISLGCLLLVATGANCKATEYWVSPGGDDTGAGELYHKAATRLEAGGRMRLAVADRGCALMVGDEWLLLNRLPQGMDDGPFQVRVVDQWIKVRDVRFAGL